MPAAQTAEEAHTTHWPGGAPSAPGTAPIRRRVGPRGRWGPTSGQPCKGAHGRREGARKHSCWSPCNVCHGLRGTLDCHPGTSGGVRGRGRGCVRESRRVCVRVRERASTCTCVAVASVVVVVVVAVTVTAAVTVVARGGGGGGGGGRRRPVAVVVVVVVVRRRAWCGGGGGSRGVGRGVPSRRRGVAPCLGRVQPAACGGGGRRARAGPASWWRRLPSGGCSRRREGSTGGAWWWRRRWVRDVGRTWGKGAWSWLASVAARARGCGRRAGVLRGGRSTRQEGHGAAVLTARLGGGCSVARRRARCTCGRARACDVSTWCWRAARARACLQVARLACARHRGARLGRVPGGDAGWRADSRDGRRRGDGQHGPGTASNVVERAACGRSVRHSSWRRACRERRGAGRRPLVVVETASRDHRRRACLLARRGARRRPRRF